MRKLSPLSLALFLPLALASVSCAGSFDVTTSAAVALTTGANYDAETSAVAIPPGGKCGDGTNVPNGRLVVASGGATLDGGGAQRLLVRDLVGGGTTKLLPLADKSIFPISEGDFGSADNQLARLKNGDLLLFWLGSTWTDFTDASGNHPEWWDDTTQPGQRGAMHVWRSHDCGDTWLYDTTMDAAKMKVPDPASDPSGQNDEGRCAWPQDAKLNGGYWPGGFDREQVYVDPFEGKVFVSVGCVGGSAKIDIPQLECDVSGLSLDCHLTSNPVDLHPGRYHEATVVFASSSPDANDLASPLVSVTGWRSTPAAITTTGAGSLFVHQCFGDEPTLHREKQPESGAYESFLAHSLSNASNLKDRYGLPGDRFAAGDPDKNADFLVGDPRVLSENLSISRVWRPAASGLRIVRLAYPAIEGYAESDGKITAGRQVWMVTTVVNKADGGVFPLITHRVSAQDPKGSVLQAAFVETDRNELDDNDEDAALLYWIEEIPDASGAPGGKLVVRGQVVRDSADWSDVFTLSDEWTPVFKEDGWRGDFMHGAFYYADGELHFVAQWAQSDPSVTGNDGTVQPNLNVFYNVATVERRTIGIGSVSGVQADKLHSNVALGPATFPKLAPRPPEALERERLRPERPGEPVRTAFRRAQPLSAPRAAGAELYYGGAGCGRAEMPVAVGVLTEGPRAVELHYFLQESDGGTRTPEVVRPMSQTGRDARVFAHAVRADAAELPPGFERLRDGRLFYYVVVTDAYGAQTRGEVYGAQPGSSIKLARCGE